MNDYNYDGFSATHYDFDNSTGPLTGQRAPDVRVFESSGKPTRLFEFDGEYLVLELGSLTCPLFQTRRAKMQALDSGNTRISNAVLYVREAHPGVDIPQHRSFKNKLDCANRLLVEDGDTRTVYVDDLAGSAHKAFGGMPNTLFIIDSSGCVVYRAQWNDTTAT